MHMHMLCDKVIPLSLCHHLIVHMLHGAHVACCLSSHLCDLSILVGHLRLGYDEFRILCDEVELLFTIHFTCQHTICRIFVEQFDHLHRPRMLISM